MGKTEIDRRTRPEWLEIGHWAAPDGWPLRRFQALPDPHVALRGSLLFQAGRADFIEKYIESFDHWRRHGWNIEGFDWRGQGGSGRVLADSRVGHSPPYSRMERDLSAYCEEWLSRTPAPHLVIGHSMGGHLVLRMLSDRMFAIDGAVLVSPMLGLNTGVLWEKAGRLIARLLCRLGWGERPAWSEGSAKGSGHRQLNLTHDAERYADEQWWRARDAMLDVGPPTWGWLRDSWESIAGLFMPGVLEGIRTPVLMLCAERDPLVTTSAIRRAARRLPDARLVCHSDAAHELLREIEPIRHWALAEIDMFLGWVGARP